LHVQPVAAFATKGAAKGHILAKIITECIHRLEKTGADVLTVVCDGASTNKAFWVELGINSDVNKARNLVD